MKGGAAGGGRSQVEPAEKINLHFNGDFHAITSAHNLLAALIDSHMFHGNELDLDPAAVTWPRTLDMNDRALRNVTLSVIVVGSTRAGEPVRAKDLGATGPMMALLSEAILPNLVQTTEGTPALVHCGPFANIAHGTSSVLSQMAGLRLADYVVNETGFASDLGFEKYMDLVMPSSGIKPAAAVLVTHRDCAGVPSASSGGD
jgi:formate--tetrahydrofolate ligase